MKEPILAFYYEGGEILNCDLDYNMDVLKPTVERCVKVISTGWGESGDTPSQILLYSVGKFIQHEGHRI